MQKYVFISYSTDDASSVITIRDHLESQGIACWMAPRDIAPGHDYGVQILDAIEAATVLLLVLSESSNHSVFVRNEVERAVAKGKIIMPFRIQPVQPSRSLEFFISNYQWIDGWEAPLTNRWDVLVYSIRSHLQGKAANQSTPISAETVSPAPSSHNLPHQLTAFVGRERELAALDELLSQPDTRLITILGPGGMGKTRLSLAVAERHLTDPHFSHGIYYVALAPVSEVQHIVTTLIDALSLSSQINSSKPQQQLLDYLRSKEMLLVFDNFEHLLSGAELVAHILQVAPKVKVLVTSRERLRLPGEYLFPLQGLDYSSPIHEDGTTESAAGQLFVQSARQLQPGFTLSGEEMAGVAHICRLVDGMPLGIELAAAWSDVLSPAEIATEIKKSLDFLEVERRGGQEHHRSIRAVFDSTWQRLDTDEQAVFARLSIFRGGFTREAAEQVAGASLRLLSTLVGKSLIQHQRERNRYTLHELLRQFAEEKLLSMPNSWAAVRDRHCTYCASFLQRQETRLKGKEYLAAMQAIEAEVENVRLSWQWAVAHKKLDEMDSALESLYIFLDRKCWFAEGDTMFGQAADALHMEVPAGKQGIMWGKILARQGTLNFSNAVEAGRDSDWERARSLCQQSIAILDKLGEQRETGLALMTLGVLFSRIGRAEEGIQLKKQALAALAEKGDSYAISRTLYELGIVNRWRGSYREAIHNCKQGIALCEKQGNLVSLGSLLSTMGNIYMVLGQYTEAKQAAESSLAAQTAINDKRGIGWSLLLLGNLAWRMGDYVTAQQHSQESMNLFLEIGLSTSAQIAMNTLGHIACSLGDHLRAREYFCTVLRSKAADRLHLHWGVAEAMLGMATILVKEGKTSQAMELLDHVLHHPVADQNTKDRAAQLLTEVSHNVPVQAERASKSLETVVAELLNN